MKQAIMGIALATIATSAFAQATPMLTQGTEFANPRFVRGYYARTVQPNTAWQGYAPGTVVEGGHVLGRDPDPNIQLQLKRDPVSDY